MTAWSKLRRAVRGRMMLGPKCLEARRSILSISFDDFPRTAWTNGGGILAARGIKATYFTAGALCGRGFDANECFTLRDLEEVAAAGHEVGCHTFEHLNLLDVDRAALASSLDKNADFIRSAIGSRPRSFAFPYGILPPIAARRLCAERFLTSRGVNFGSNSGIFDGSNLRGASLGLGGSRMRDLESLFEKTKATGGWVVLVTHDVQEKPSSYGCKPGHLEWVIRCAQQYGFEIKPIGEVYTRDLLRRL